ncbi:hypothetical protein NLI96_g4363 [Meripilus lineatus]|uniref:OPT oligopeptide transporter n=1 Tax=Meripilus lineatus TaxID=2056292 RepID=A0AAD5V540_9APHY|nr:hypothetical protein NLI96_g4363 [Physisporinus lineatus]
MNFINGHTAETEAPPEGHAPTTPTNNGPIRRLVHSWRRASHPDVPEDASMLHFNDLNWDPPSSPSSSTDSFDLSEKGPSGPRTYSSGFSTRSSDIDTDSQDGSQYKDEPHLKEADEEIDEESPYAEVRAAISNKDDPNMPVNTFRMWFMGGVFAVLMSGINHLMGFRWPSVGISAIVVQLLALPFGRGLEYLLPRRKFTTFGYTWSFNPGPFNIKEHTVITVMANLLYSDAYCTAITATQEIFYGQQLSYKYKITLILSTQLLGYSYAGLVRQYLVWPSSMIWPGALVECALLNTLHKNYGEKSNRHMSRYKFFFLVTAIGALYYFIPGFLFTALSMFTWVCWIAPTNQTVNALFGYQTGLGMGFLTFDWSMISWLSSPLVSPWWSEANVFAGFVFFMWFLAPIFYFTNVFYTKYLPISAAMAFDNTGAPYQVSAIISDGVFNQTAYEAYSPLYLPATFIISYGAQFASLSAIIVHVFLWYRHDIIRQFRRSVRDERDVHARLMSAYPEVPHWWYLTLGLVSFGFGVAAIKVFDTDFPVWALVLAIVMALCFIVPIGIIRAVTNQLVTINVFSQIVAGYLLPNRPIAVMLFKTFSFVSMAQGISFTSDLKVGHYMKIPPRTMFMAQVLATILAAFVITAVQDWMFANIDNICTPLAKGDFTCPQITTFATSSLVWGAIGPQRMFSKGSLYNPMLWFFLLGAIVPIPCYFLARRYPRSLWRYINMPLIFSSTAVMPPSSGINYSSWIMVGFIFQYFMRRFHFRWWMRYNYILSAALDSGAVIGALIVFFSLIMPNGGVELNWWGNTVWQKTFDAMGMPALTVTPPEIFGLQTWS